MIDLNIPSWLILEDDCLLGINKPAGVLTLPDGYDPHAPHIRSLVEPILGQVWIIHRLDRDTSGVLLLARTSQAHQICNDQFASHQVQKCYHALVQGEPTWQVEQVDLPLQPNTGRRHRTVVDRRSGKPCLTDFKVMERFRGYALVAAHPHTGRRHQVRAHLAALGFHLVADTLYGVGRPLYLADFKQGYLQARPGQRPLLGRVGLHAWSLDLAHPQTGGILHLEAAYPEDFQTALDQLRRYARAGK